LKQSDASSLLNINDLKENGRIRGMKTQQNVHLLLWSDSFQLTPTTPPTIRYIVTPSTVPIAYPTTPHTVAAIVRPCSLDTSRFIRLQNAAAVAGPPMAAFDAIQISSSSKSLCLLFHNKLPRTVNKTCTTKAIAENNIHDGPIDNDDDKFAANPIDPKNDKKKKSLHIDDVDEHGIVHQLCFKRTEFRYGATIEITAHVIPGTIDPTIRSTLFATSTIQEESGV
jgi:hypothetical protein